MGALRVAVGAVSGRGPARRGPFGVGLAYSRITPPYPAISLFEGEETKETALMDAGGQMGWLRYGAGDWRTGWAASKIRNPSVSGMKRAWA
jgi:hypothetical protein